MIEQNDSKILSRERVKQIFQDVMGIAKDADDVRINIKTEWTGSAKWARNKVVISTDARDFQIRIGICKNENWGMVSTNQIDTKSLESAVLGAAPKVERPIHREMKLQLNIPVLPTASIWSEATYTALPKAFDDVVPYLTGISHKQGMVSAGYLEMYAADVASYTASSGTPSFVQYTSSQCSTTVRHPKGRASGWSGQSSYDWSSVNWKAIADVAVDKAVRSLNPVAIEPGRYHVILEPQAASDIVNIMMGYIYSERARELNEERPDYPFHLSIDRSLKMPRSKLGLQIVDKQVNIYHDPLEASMGVVPRGNLKRVDWIKDGVLNSLAHDYEYSQRNKAESAFDLQRYGYTMAGGTTSVGDMIASMKRGLLVSRFYGLSILDTKSLMTTGNTRDGLWLIENGKIIKSIVNFRFADSPLFALNQIDAIGPTVLVYRPLSSFINDLGPVSVPALSIKDFSFVSLVDAI